MEKLKITQFVDPACTWCWGSSPIMRALEYRYGEQIEICYTMCGMIDDIRTFSNRRLDIGGDIEMSNRNMMKAWLEASQVHGMPVEEHHFHLFSEERTSTIPLNLAYIAAKQCCERGSDGRRNITKANRYLRRLQEATAVEAMHTNDIDVLVDLSAVLGFEPNRFREEIEGTRVREKYENDCERCRAYGVESTPTYLLEYKGEELILQGFTTCETLERNIKQFTYDALVLHKREQSGRERLSLNRNNVKDYIQRYGTVYPVEIATAFSLERYSGKSALNIESYRNLPDVIEELLKAELIGITPQGNGFQIYDIKEKLTDTQRRERQYAGTF